MVAFGGGGDGGGDSLERLRREVESQRARIRELEATNRAQEEALSQRDRQLALASLPAPFIRDMQEAEYIRSSMRKHNAHTLSATVALVKGAYYSRYGQPPGYVEAVTDLQGAVDATPQEEHLRARQLLAMNPSERRIAIRKQAKTTVDFSTDPRVLRAYRRLEGVAEWPQLKEFRLSAEELAECVQTKKQRLLETQTKSAAGGQRQVIPNGDALVTWCEDVFHLFNNTVRPSPTVEDEPNLSHLCTQDLEDKLTVALLLTLGRRTYEIRSGMSTFAPVPDNIYGAYASTPRVDAAGPDLIFDLPHQTLDHPEACTRICSWQWS